MAPFSTPTSMKTFNMKIISTLTLFFSLAMVAFTPQGSIDEVIGAINEGKAKSLGRYIDENIEITLPDKSNNYSKAQAILVLEDFFGTNKVKAFDVKHKGDQNGGQYCVGTLQTKSGNYRTTIFMKSKAGRDVVKEIRFQPIE
jgi:F420-dependent methylenetetrahydromethanopterin dehydrogenase